MLIYIILYSLLLLSICFERENIRLSIKSKVLAFWVTVFTLFRGLRWNTGTDWEQYYMVFKSADWNSIFSFERGYGLMEPGYMFINALIRNFGGNYTVFLLLTNLFILIAYAKFAQTNSKTPIYVFVLIMFSTQFFPVRIGIAVAFIISGLCSFSQKRYVRVAVCTLLAASMHKSALLFVPAYFLIFCRKMPTVFAVSAALAALILSQLEKVQDVFQPLSLLVGYFGGEEVAGKYEHYFEYNEFERSSALIRGVSTLLNSVIFITTLIPFGKMIDYLSKKGNKINYAFMYNIYIFFVIIGILFSNDEMANLKRLQNYFMFAFPILFSEFTAYGRKRYVRYKFIFLYIFIGYVLFRSHTLFFSGYLEAYFPYKSIFD